MLLDFTAHRDEIIRGKRRPRHERRATGMAATFAVAIADLLRRPGNAVAHFAARTPTAEFSFAHKSGKHSSTNLEVSRCMPARRRA